MALNVLTEVSLGKLIDDPEFLNEITATWKYSLRPCIICGSIYNPFVFKLVHKFNYRICRHDPLQYAPDMYNPYIWTHTEIIADGEGSNRWSHAQYFTLNEVPWIFGNCSNKCRFCGNSNYGVLRVPIRIWDDDNDYEPIMEAMAVCKWCAMFICDQFKNGRINIYYTIDQWYKDIIVKKDSIHGRKLAGRYAGRIALKGLIIMEFAEVLTVDVCLGIWKIMAFVSTIA